MTVGALIALVLFLLLIVAALVAAMATRALLCARPARVTGGAADSSSAAADSGGSAAPVGAGLTHPVANALHDYAVANLGAEQVMGPHDLSGASYGGGAVKGGAAVKKPAAKKPPSKKPWTEYETWEALKRDKGAEAAYLRDRANVLEYPNLDWSNVMALMGPKLHEPREHIGVVNLDADGRTLHIARSEPSPIEAGTMGDDAPLAFAGVPAELVAKYAARPGLILFHTHPADLRCGPFPSSHDLSTALIFGATARFAAHAVISRYGVFVYGIDWATYRDINSAKNWDLAMLNVGHDVVASHEAVRSWAPHTIPEYFQFYSRHRFLLFVYPSPELVGDIQRTSHRPLYEPDVEGAVDHELIGEYVDRIKQSAKTARQRGGRTPIGRDARVRAHTLRGIDNAPTPVFD